MKTLLLGLLALTACTDANDPMPPVTLANDAYFVAVFAPYSSPEDCIARSVEPRGCRFAITLCKNGRAGERVADIVSSGTYEMIDNVAVATFTNGTGLEFDVAARKKSSDSPTTTWIVDVNKLHETMPFDTITCD